MTTPANLRRWYLPRYGLRTLFVLVTVVAIGMGWIGIHLKWKHDRISLRSQFVHTMFPDIGKPGPFSLGLRLVGEAPISTMTVYLKKDGDAIKAEEFHALFPECNVAITKLPPGERWID